MEAREWLKGPGKRLLAFFKPHGSYITSRIIEAVYEAGASLVTICNIAHHGEDQMANEIEVRSPPEKEGDVMIALSRFDPRVMRRVKKSDVEHIFTAWWS